MRRFLKKFNMRKKYKIVNIALIFMLIEVFLWGEFAYGLRVPMGNYDSIKKAQIAVFESQSTASPIDETITSSWYKREEDPLETPAKYEPFLSLQGMFTAKGGKFFINDHELTTVHKNFKGEVLPFRTNLYQLFTILMQEKGLGSFDLDPEGAIFNFFIPNIGDGVGRFDEALINSLMTYLTDDEIAAWRGQHQSSYEYIYALFKMLKDKPLRVEVTFDIYRLPVSYGYDWWMELRIVNYNPLRDKDRKKLRDAFAVLHTARDQKAIEDGLQKAGIWTEHSGKGLAGITVGIADYISLFRFRELPDRTEQTIRMRTYYEGILSKSCIQRVEEAAASRLSEKLTHIFPPTDL